MRALLVLMLAGIQIIGAEVFLVHPKDAFTMGIDLKEGVNSRINMQIENLLDGLGRVEVKDPNNGLIKSFSKEEVISMAFTPKSSGIHNVSFFNDGKVPVNFTVELPEMNEGPFADSRNSNKVKELDELLRSIIDAQKGLLSRQSKHLEMAKTTKGWIRKLTLLEVIICLLALYYVHGEAVKTFYSTKKI
ncbi:hypothetical protein NEFER03_0900 [Nematocida sp. LUAm3]|nr:hypothetical protein NEFER03_0900 [Nematocida sp. LUAm3]KAI5174918.1 hypothetical protein NEFER02_1018 [Nematocida sp. LUAm2]KAI5177483.1 hypothetical protein NEFER01_0733 [Nematocida sp. LUAm1]